MEKNLSLFCKQEHASQAPGKPAPFPWPGRGRGCSNSSSPQENHHGAAFEGVLEDGK